MSEMASSDTPVSLQQSLEESPLPKPRKTVPHRKDSPDDDLLAVGRTRRITVFRDGEPSPEASSQQEPPLASPNGLNGTDTGLPPTPPSNSEDQTPPASISPPPHPDGITGALISKQPSLTTPVNQRSPPTPDPSPPRTKAATNVAVRPPFSAVPTSRTESFMTAREDPFSEGDSGSNTPTPKAVPGKRSFDWAFDQAQNPRADTHTPELKDQEEGREDTSQSPALDPDKVPNREWNTERMRNVTVRRGRHSPSKAETEMPQPPDETPLANGTTPRRSTSLRERVEASKNSPQTLSIENFAQSIGWPTEVNSKLKEHLKDTDEKRHSGSSAASTVVEAMVIVTPPRRRRTLRHTGRNLAYQRVVSADASFNQSRNSSNRNSVDSQDLPLRRLVHKQSPLPARRLSTTDEPDSPSREDSPSPIYIRKRQPEYIPISALHRPAGRLDPTAEFFSKAFGPSEPSSRRHQLKSYHKRVVSAPESTRVPKDVPKPHGFFQFSPPTSPENAALATSVPAIEQTSPSTPGLVVQDALSVRSAAIDSQMERARQASLDLNKSLPHLPDQPTEPVAPNYSPRQEPSSRTTSPPPALESHGVRVLEGSHQNTAEPQKGHGNSTSVNAVTPHRPSWLARGQSDEVPRSSFSKDRTSTSRDTLPHSYPDRSPTEELPRHSYEWNLLHPDDHRRISFDRSTVRTEEHAMARHLYAQSTPFSQFSDTPDALEVSEATAVSIFPHNNHSLLVVQHVSRSNTISRDQRQIAQEMDAPSSDILSSPLQARVEELERAQQPKVTFEPSTPPMPSAAAPAGVDSPLKNPRKPPEPPVIKFIPPTPADELDRQLAPGPPPKSEGRPQRRLSLVQRARRYSDNFISPLLARASSTRSRTASDSQANHDKTHVPTVTEGDGSLHPFWRPRGFWEGFDDSDDDDEPRLPHGSEVKEVTAAPRLGLSVLGRRFSNRMKRSEGFLIGNSLSIERSGTNRRRPHIILPSQSRGARTRTRKAQEPADESNEREDSPGPKIIIQPPTLPSRPRSPRVTKRGSRPSIRSARSHEMLRRDERRGSWRKGKTIPGLGMQIQYIGISGVKDRIREKRAEKRRDAIRKSIGTRYFVEGGDMVGNGAVGKEDSGV